MSNATERKLADGVVYQVVAVANSTGEVSDPGAPEVEAVAAGAFPKFENIIVLGARPLVPVGSSGIVETIALSAAQIPPGGAAATVVSTSALDVGVTFVITALDGDFVKLPPIVVVLNGTTPVSIGVVTRILFAYRVAGDLIGQMNINTGGSLIGAVEAGGSSLRHGRYTVPSNANLCITGLTLGMNRSTVQSGSSQFELKTKPVGATGYGTLIAISLARDGNNTVQISSRNPVSIPAGQDVAIFATASDGSTSANVAMEGFLIYND